MNTLTDGGTAWIQSALDDAYKSDHYIYPDEILFDQKNIYFLSWSSMG